MNTKQDIKNTPNKSVCKFAECNCVVLTDCCKCLLLYSTACSECFPLNISLVSQTNPLPGTLIVTHTKHLLITFQPPAAGTTTDSPT